MDVSEELWRHRLLVLGDGGGELALLDVVQPPQLLHADFEVSRPLYLRQLAEKRDVGRGHFVDVVSLCFSLYNFYSISVCKLESPDDLAAFPLKIEKLLHSLTDRVKTLFC